MALMQGVVENVSTKYGYAVQIDGEWYSTKPEWLKVKPERGDEISFDSGPEGRKYLKNVVILNGGSGGTADTSSNSATTNRVASFPIAADARERSICRQSSLKAAIETLSLVQFYNYLQEDTAEEAVARTSNAALELAIKYEKYVTGDYDQEIRKQLEEGE